MLQYFIEYDKDLRNLHLVSKHTSSISHRLFYHMIL